MSEVIEINDLHMVRRLSHQLFRSLSSRLSGQWTGVNIIESKINILCPD